MFLNMMYAAPTFREGLKLPTRNNEEPHFSCYRFWTFAQKFEIIIPTVTSRNKG